MNYTTDVVILGRRRSKRKMPKLYEEKALIPVSREGRVNVAVWISEPNDQYPLPRLFMLIGFGRSYTLIPFPSPAELEEFVKKLGDFITDTVFKAEKPGERGILEAWEDALEAAKELLDIRLSRELLGEEALGDEAFLPNASSPADSADEG